jgi:phosphinothricin acetyltransferase
MTARYERTLAQGLPYIVAELDGEVRGYAHAGPYRLRPAYRFTVEDRSTSRPASRAAVWAGCCSKR